MPRNDWNHIKDIFNDALRQDTGTRPAFLDTACGGDIDLRIEVESLLIAFEEGKSFLETPVIGETSKSGGWRLSNGQIISHFKILSPIASGGMGEVYLAEDQNLRRQVALKILPEHLHADKDRLRRFQREAQAVSTLNHPNILTIFEFAEQDAMHIFASEFVKGETLRLRVGKGRVPVSETLDIGIQIASALRAAHAAGVIHRDIKPENIMIRDDGFVKVLDFGLAKLTEQTSSDLEADTKMIFSQPGVIMGTVTYMSPEQTRARTIDARSDLFSFGVVLFEMLTGRVPFAGETTTDVIAEIIQVTPRLVSSYNSSVPEELDRLIAKCLEKDRDERYQTASDLLADLKRIAKRSEPTAEAATIISTPLPAGQVTEILTERPTGQTEPEPSRRRSKFITAGAIAAIVIAAIAIGYWYFIATKQIDSIAVMPFENQSGNPDVDYLSDGMTESLINSLSKLPNLNVKARNTVFRYKGTDIDQKKIGLELSVQAVLVGRIIQRDDDLILYLSLIDAGTGNLLWGEQYNRKLKDLTALQTEITRDVSQKLRMRLSSADEKMLAKNYTENAEAYQLYLKGRYFWGKRTPESIRKAIEYFNLAIEKDPGFALAYAGLADSYVVPANRIPPRDAMPKAKAAATRALEIDDTLAEAHTSLGRVLQVYDWNWKDAEKEFKRAIELNPSYPVAHQWYGGYLERMGNIDGSISERKLALELDPLSTITNFELAQAFYFARNYDQAIEQFQRTLELDPSFPAAIQRLPAVYLQKGMYDEAIAKIQAAPESADMASTGEPGYAYAASGRTKEARIMLDELKRRRDQQYISAVSIALIYAGLGEKDEAFAWLEKGFEERAFQMQYLKVEPRWDGLRSDPRFVDLVRRIGLP
jgi:serine/threonine protein kinase